MNKNCCRVRWSLLCDAQGVNTQCCFSLQLKWCPWIRGCWRSSWRITSWKTKWSLGSCITDSSWRPLGENIWGSSSIAQCVHFFEPLPRCCGCVPLRICAPTETWICHFVKGKFGFFAFNLWILVTGCLHWEFMSDQRQQGRKRWGPSPHEDPAEASRKDNVWDPGGKRWLQVSSNKFFIVYMMTGLK